ncbi:hypothetical protein J5N97_012771 [Dioscorea zingiberensis]|uniref:Non-specific serine/threonine protein kinase n=1 Tax=Dioscorea zingiberensis TaxID=325984 RepID=A0A9D5HIF3_9LILI|nr:hypothetical protein J5N97_012771 [Dioscorea zingiberensis]
MAPITNYELHAQRLVDPELSVQARLQMVMEVRDSLEIAHTSEYLNFLKCYFRAFTAVLTQLTMPQPCENPEHKLRNVVVEILNRLPHSEVLRPFVQDLLKLSLQVLTHDNEDNALISIRIIFDLLRNFRPTVESEVQPFLDFVCSIYRNFPATVSYFFSSSAPPPPPNPPNPSSGTMDDALDPGGPVGHSGSGQLNPSNRSFKIVTESPLVVMFLFQLYHKLVQTNIPYLLPLMVAAISLPGPDKVPSHLKTQYMELKGAQVKTLSFLTYLLKSCTDYIRPHEENICKSIVNLLVTCPDAVSIRSTDFKQGLFPLIDTLLDERVLIGTGRVCIETLRPLAYSLLAEIVHYVRGDLSLSQLSRIIYLFSRNMHDSSLTLVIHTTCARLMLNLVEPIYEKGTDQPSMDEARVLLGRILDTFVGKFGTFKRIIPQLLEESEEGKERPLLRLKLEVPIQAALNLQPPLEYSKEVNDYKNLIKTLVMGMKTIIWSITNAHAPRSQVSPSTHGAHPQMQVSPSSNSALPQVFKGMREDESGVHCLALFKEKDEERGNVAMFFTNLSHNGSFVDLMDMFSLCMPELFECMITNTQLLHIFSTLLQAQKVLRPFTDVLVNYLVSNKLDTLKQPDTPAAKLVLQLFRFVFVAVAKAPTECERVLQPHVHVIMDVCMKSATEVDRPLGYMHLLRNMFRSLNGAKFDNLLRDLIPSLQPCLNLLLAMIEGPTTEDMKDLLIELCLTLPARLSSLLPHLPRLMKPLVLALKGSDDLVSLGLRTLEFWIDSLNPDFLEPSMANVMSEVILGLWSHLRPPPYPWGTKALQLLVPMDRCIHLAVASVMQTNVGMDDFYRKQALKFLRICLVSVLNFRGNIDESGISHGLLATLLVSPVDPSLRCIETSDMKLALLVQSVLCTPAAVDLMDVLADENRHHAKAALTALNFFSEALLLLAQTKQTGVIASRSGPGTPMVVSSPSLNPVYSPPPGIRIPSLSSSCLVYYIVAMEVGTVSALNFCLALRPPLLKLTPELVNFLQEALQIAEADETVWVSKLNNKVVTTLNKLRTACIELLCTAMAWADLKTTNHTELRAKIISMFFKSLTCRTPEIVAVAKEGLRQVIQQQRMPKDLLQSSLRPILVNLAHTKSLNMPLLQGLARLLELLSNWFNVTLGVKLLDHLKKWLEPEKLAQCQKSWKNGDEPKVAAAMIELFHLLPPAAGKFLDDLVTIIIDLEGALPQGQFYSEINSPYRLPLTKFLNRYATDSVDYFLARLNHPKYFRR